MKKDQVENLLLIAVKLGQAMPSKHPVDIARNLGKLQKLAVSLRKRYENMCNYQWASGDVFEAHTSRLEKRVIELSAELGVKSDAQRDPRGASVCLKLGTVDYWLF